MDPLVRQIWEETLQYKMSQNKETLMQNYLELIADYDNLDENQVQNQVDELLFQIS